MATRTAEVLAAIDSLVGGVHASRYDDAAHRRDQAFSLFPSFDDTPRHRANQEATA